MMPDRLVVKLIRHDKERMASKREWMVHPSLPQGEPAEEQQHHQNPRITGVVF